MSLSTNWRENTGLFVCNRSGDDATGNGTKANPYKTMKKAIEGTTTNPLIVNIRAGYYNEGEIQINTASPIREVQIISDGLSVIDGAGFSQFEIAVGAQNRVGVSFYNCIIQNTTIANGVIGDSQDLGLNVYFKNSTFSGDGRTNQNNDIINITSSLNYRRGQASSNVRTRKQTYIGCTINYPTTQYALTAPLGGDFNFYDKGTTIATTQNAQPYDFDNCGFESNGTAVTIDGVRIDNIQINSDLDTIGNTYASNERFSGTATINAGLANQRTAIFFNCFYTDDPLFNNEAIGDYTLTPASPLVNSLAIIGRYSVAIPLNAQSAPFTDAGASYTNVTPTGTKFILDVGQTEGTVTSTDSLTNCITLPFPTTVSEAVQAFGTFLYNQGEWIDKENYNPATNPEVRLTWEFSALDENTLIWGPFVNYEVGLPLETDNAGLGNGNVNADMADLGAITAKRFRVRFTIRTNGV